MTPSHPLQVQAASFFGICSALLISSASFAESPSPVWGSFHGVDGQGFVANEQLPDQWTDNDYAWKQQVAARDVGSPVVSGGKVFLMESAPDQETISLTALDLNSGKRRWTKSYDQPAYHLHSRNTYASSTPAADDQFVFAAWSNPEHTYLKCFDHDGTEVWSRDFGTWQSQHGFGTSPRIFGSLVLLMNSQQANQLKEGQVAGKSRMIAVDRATGETVWETDLKTTKACYGVPAIYQGPDGSKQIIGANTGNGLFGIDPETGKMLWNKEVFEMRCCSSPLIVGDIAIGSSGSGGGGNHLVAVQIPQSNSDDPKQIYRIDRGAPYVPTPVIRGEHMFTVDDKGIAACWIAATGEEVWRQRIGGKFGASPIVVGDKLLLVSLDGEAVVIRASEDYELISRFDLGGPVGATPAFVSESEGGRLLLRVGNEMRCLKTTSHR